MPRLRDISLRRKQTLIIMLITGIALLLACAALMVYESISFRIQLAEDVTVLAEAIGNNCVAAIDFNDPKAAAETLAALRVNKSIVTACVYTPEGKVFAVFQRDRAASFIPPPRRVSAQEFRSGEVHIFRPIRQKGEAVGAIYVASDLKNLSVRLVRYSGIVAAVFLASLVIAFVLSTQLHRLVSDPILRLAQVARSVALEKNYSVRATKQSNDELGQLVDGFNEMLVQIQLRDSALQTARDDLEKRVAERTSELESIHKQLVDVSRRGGMAEIATNVLHNVGNVLNSVNISTGLLVERVKKSKTSSFAKLVVLLREHSHDLGTFLKDDPRGKHVATLLGQLSEQLSLDQQAFVVELDSLRSNVEHIKEIVAMQQTYATFGGVKEMVSVTSLVDDSLRISEGAMGRHGVKVVREYENVPLMNVEKHKILQILVNLLRNAKHACQDSDRLDKRITVRVADGNGQVRISVTDNGVGIPPENLNRIFNHGFTTRETGHGFGLHSGALAAKEMGGSLTAQSAGWGHGAAFTLELPFATEELSNV